MQLANRELNARRILDPIFLFYFVILVSHSSLQSQRIRLPAAIRSKTADPLAKKETRRGGGRQSGRV
jgi:hypothetical protein